MMLVDMNDHDLSLLATFVRERLNKLKMSQAEAARISGISQGALSSLLNEKAVPETSTVEKLAKALQVPRQHMLMLLAGYPDDPQSDLDPMAAYIARRLSDLPDDLRELAIDAVAGVVDAFYVLERSGAERALTEERSEAEDS